MKYVVPVRRTLGVRTVFNVLGSLTNLAGAASQLIGVFHIDLVGILSHVFQQLGSKHALVVHGSDELDEGVDIARKAIDSSKARAKREEVAAFSQKLAAQQAK